MTEHKKLILIDLDGVLNQYKGDFKKDFIPPIKDGAVEFLKAFNQSEYIIKLFTSRNKILASKWVIENGLENIIEDVTNIKEPCFLLIDDRCINFNGDYQDILDKVKNFNCRYKR